MLELDLLVGSYAEQHLPHMDEQQLKFTEKMLMEESPDLWRWITAQEAPPDRLIANSVFLVCCFCIDMVSDTAEHEELPRNSQECCPRN
jgi:succinate dehydrogenase flavin-adding protein (antitoxin of CptAB toxin-antitoxin module)